MILVVKSHTIVVNVYSQLCEAYIVFGFGSLSCIKNKFAIKFFTLLRGLILLKENYIKGCEWTGEYDVMLKMRLSFLRIYVILCKEAVDASVMVNSYGNSSSRDVRDPGNDGDGYNTFYLVC